MQEWSAAKSNCKQEGKTLAKIRGIEDLLRAQKEAFQTYHADPPGSVWVGVKFNTSIGDFVWGDGTRVPSDVNFEAIVNRNRHSSPNSENCMSITSNERYLNADDCEIPRRYICQSGEHDEPGNFSCINLVINKRAFYLHTWIYPVSILLSPILGIYADYR